MKYELAESILANTMKHWETVDMNKEIKDIQIISEIKYDDYQQFTHGMRYIESLALWMRQFERNEEKDCAYRLVKDKLVYISEEEMRQLISYSFKISMKKYLLEKTKKFCDEQSITDLSERKQIYKYLVRSSLFLGLSDGAHIDFFRRQNPQLSNEQVFVHYDFSEEKAKDMLEKLNEEEFIVGMRKQYEGKLPEGFSSYFLIDDFTGSGKSYMRKDEKGWHGKICKFVKRLGEVKYNVQDADIHVLLYVSTQKSFTYLRNQINTYCKEKNVKGITLDSLQGVKPLDFETNNELYELLKRNYDKHIVEGDRSYNDVHFKVGEGGSPFLGFADCALPLVLYHNTPNNSLPLLWYSWEDKVNALFPRITRHKEI